MTSDKEKFLTLKKDRGGDVVFVDNGTTRILGRGTIALKGNAKAQEVLYVDGLKHDLLSVGQICDSNHNITFFSPL